MSNIYMRIDFLGVCPQTPVQPRSDVARVSKSLKGFDTGEGRHWVVSAAKKTTPQQQRPQSDTLV